MNDNFRLVYSKKDISEVEQKLLEKFAEDDGKEPKNGSGDIPPVESILKVFVNDTDDSTYMIYTYLLNESIGVACARIPANAWFDGSSIKV